MNRNEVVAHLAQAERHVTQGEEHLARQRKLIDELTRDGHDTTTAIDLLRTFEQTQASHVQGRDRLRREVSKMEPV